MDKKLTMSFTKPKALEFIVTLVMFNQIRAQKERLGGFLVEKGLNTIHVFVFLLFVSSISVQYIFCPRLNPCEVTAVVTLGCAVSN